MKLGIPAGIVAAVGLTRYPRGMLFGITPLDVTTFIGVGAAFAALAEPMASIRSCPITAR